MRHFMQGGELALLAMKINEIVEVLDDNPHWEHTIKDFKPQDKAQPSEPKRECGCMNQEKHL